MATTSNNGAKLRIEDVSLSFGSLQALSGINVRVKEGEILAISASELFLPVDLCRMNRIVEIDEKNRFVGVEPYVSVQLLFTEAIKKGLRPASVGCGPSASIIASSTSHFGCGTSSVSTDYSGRTPLGVEWVLACSPAMAPGQAYAASCAAYPAPTAASASSPGLQSR